MEKKKRKKFCAVNVLCQPSWDSDNTALQKVPQLQLHVCVCVYNRCSPFCLLTGLLREGLHYESPRGWRQDRAFEGAHVRTGLQRKTEINVACTVGAANCLFPSRAI